ncbi:hypothetical protein B0H67DRAFT_640935 [Lasiosphaeris hirsuta]|uniref:Uncharacterized protein n=1 Tax=Lasiosphaeris hirsuta TaxID=260670 RepID=A0AA40E2B2_9PEZI|nr:hypothetical protein B0H67DRAFT_640935 [Lasiosphaeris hirsuta]
MSLPVRNSIKETWLRLFRQRPVAVAVGTSRHPKGFVMATLYMLLVSERREVLKAFGNWAGCRCRPECRVACNFSRNTGLYRGGTPKSCVLVKRVEAD